MPRRSLAVLLVVLLAATACSSDDKKPATKPGISGTSQAKGDLVLDVVGADVVSSSRERRPLDERARRQAAKVLQRTFDATVVDALTTGKGGNIGLLFTPDARRSATGADRGAVFDEGFAPIPMLVGSKTDVLLTALDGEDGNPAVLVAKFDWAVRSQDNVVSVHRVGELTLVPAFGTWLVGAYTMLVNRTAGGRLTTTTAVSP